MKCPTDNATLMMTERSGIEIDYCPECRGVWLDRGELDKILDRAAAEAPAAPVAPAAPSPVPQQQYAEPRYTEPRYDDRRGGHGQQPYRKKKKEHWLSELFD
jgi:Zn-finger nucleic acid-binding protein